MNTTHPIFWKGAGLLGAFAMRHWMGTIDFKIAYSEPEVDFAYYNGKEQNNVLLLFWHEHILGPLFLRRHCDVTMLLSRHVDAEIVNRIAHLFGLRCIRGSSFRGGASALKELMRTQSRTNIAITPDGPRGPRRELAVGAVFLASKLQIPILLAGIGYDRPWRANSWDRFVVPRPFSRGRLIISPRIWIPKELSKDDIIHHRDRLEQMLNFLTDEAEDWAVSGEPLLGECPISPGPKFSLTYRGSNRLDE